MDEKKIVFNAKEDAADVLRGKLADAWEVPGFEAEFDPEEAELAGAFVEDALSYEDALESSADLLMDQG
jgi:hypothetical protein